MTTTMASPTPRTSAQGLTTTRTSTTTASPMTKTVDALALSAGHSFIVFLGAGFFPINVLYAIRNVPEVVNIYCATANPVEVIVAETDRAGAGDYGQLLAAEPDLPIIRANLNADSVQIITSHRIGTRPADLLTALAELPKRR